MRTTRPAAKVVSSVLEHVGWLANGQGFVAAADILNHYFQTAQVSTEIDLRCALLALSDGRRTYPNPARIMTSARRILVNAENFAAWCFFKSTYCSH